jgi:hypothetical protein
VGEANSVIEPSSVRRELGEGSELGERSELGGKSQLDLSDECELEEEQQPNIGNEARHPSLETTQGPTSEPKHNAAEDPAKGITHQGSHPMLSDHG